MGLVEHLKLFLVENGFEIGRLDPTLFIKQKKNDQILVQVYVDNIIFGATNNVLFKEFSKCMQETF